MCHEKELYVGHLAPRDTRSEVLQLLVVTGGGGGTPPPIGNTLHPSLNLQVNGGEEGTTPPTALATSLKIFFHLSSQNASLNTAS